MINYIWTIKKLNKAKNVRKDSEQANLTHALSYKYHTDLHAYNNKYWSQQKSNWKCKELDQAYYQ